jgi:hypothetical protein
MNITIEKRPMQQHIGGSCDYVFQSRQKALSKFFELADELDLEVFVTHSKGFITYEGGGRGYDYRIELTLTSIDHE